MILEPIPEDPRSAWEAGVAHGRREALNLLESEARWQWELDARRTPCAQVAAQRLGVLMSVLRDRLNEDR
ncbi:hypothetical protein CM00_gp69 [Mycobacterium phage Kugel]|uniref:Uncharacterized protein n=1 Tax=Mycobacterium phage Kugel TaxID=2923003 RepID=G8IBA7_9CAUD|nr:hypothetical protein CM00_gp69 [Mycobacterium phage Kugel]AER49999.1 hypothetical protein KUGEL_69 [Mycobacterium phage Kugel]